MRQPKIAEIRAAVAALYGLTPADLNQGGKCRRYSWPRQVSMYLAGRLTSQSWRQIAMRYGQDHKSVVFSAKRVAERLKVDQALEYAVGLLIRQLTWGSNETPNS